MSGANDFTSLILMALPAVAGIFLAVKTYTRQAEDVLDDLLDQELSQTDLQEDDSSRASVKGLVLGDDLANAGIIKNKERRRFLLCSRLLPLGFCFAFLAVRSLWSSTLPGLFFSGLFGLAAGYIASRVWFRVKKQNYHRRLEFYLPIVMERIVMAVEAGLDIIPAVAAAVEAGWREKIKTQIEKQDPVCELLSIVYKLTESGLGFEESLKSIAEKVDSRPLRHAFIHLAVAQSEGGEVIMPLRELSDATQIYYQESVEEEIARMPAKATMPLLCAFGGLVVCFLTSPLIQVLSLVQKSMPK